MFARFVLKLDISPRLSAIRVATQSHNKAVIIEKDEKIKQLIH